MESNDRLRAAASRGSANRVDNGLSRLGHFTARYRWPVMALWLVLTVLAGVVPALMRLMGDAKWWMPNWLGFVLRIPPRAPKPREEVPKAPPVPVV